MTAPNSGGGARPRIATGLSRWWVYQRERFPLIAHGLLIAAFSSSAVCFSCLLAGRERLPPLPVFAVAFCSSFIAFLHLRIADEFKDIDEDTRFRPYRPVPRGLVTLRELGWLAAVGFAFQAALALWLAPHLLWLLAITWLYLLLMSKEFFLRDWLKGRPFTYMWSHMLIMPLIDFYATACEWITHTTRPPDGLFLFVIVSFFNGIVVEVGRKLRAPNQEEEGVETYTALWGPRRACVFWLTAMSGCAATAILAGHRIGFALPIAGATLTLVVIAAWRALCFCQSPTSTKARWFEPLAGVWTLCLYLMLGLVPAVVHSLRETP